MADGITSLSNLVFGTSTGGAASAGETTLSLGVDRGDQRTAPDLFHVWAAQLNAVKNLALTMSVFAKGGTRLQVLSQSASPFGAGEIGFWSDGTNPKFSAGGVAQTLLAPSLSAKGDLITYSGSAVAVLPVGSNTFVLTADSTQPNGIKWAASGGGSSTLALLYAAGASQADSTITYDATRGFLKLLDASSTLGTLLQIRNNADSLTYVSFTSNSQHFFRSGQVDGAAAVGTAVDTNAGWVNATSKPFRVLTGGAERFSVTGPGNILLVANAVVTAASALTNTAGMSHVANVATGATSIGHLLNNTTDLTTGTLLSVQSAGTERFGFAWSGAVATLTGGSTITSFLASDGTGFQGNSGAAFIRNAGSATYQFTATNFTPAGAQTLGAAGTPFPSSFISRPVVTNQIIAAAASITVNPASGDYVRINLSATAITSLTVSAGQNGEEMVVEVVEDATGTRTIPTTWTNVAFAGGTYTVSTGANKHDFISFIYNSTLAKWCETGRALNMS